MPESFETLVEKAEELLKQKDWSTAQALFSSALQQKPDHIGVLIGISICYLSQEAPRKAIPHLERVTELAPDSAESWVNLGSAYLSAGNYSMAEKFYLRATDIDPSNLAGWKLLAQLYLSQESRLQEGVKVLAAILEDYPEDLDSLLMLGQCYEAGEDFASAQLLYEKAVQVEPQNSQAQQVLKAVKSKTGQNGPETKDLLTKLSSLKGLNMKSKPAAYRAAFYSNGEVSDPMRVINPARALHDKGCLIYAGVIFREEDLEKYDYFIFSRPQITRTQMGGIRMCREAGKTIFIDLDDDFLHMPRSHPGYKEVGPGSKASVKRLKTALEQADYLSTPSPVIAERYAEYVKKTFVIPNNWWKGNELWLKPAQRRRTVNIGWAGTITHRKDFRLILTALENISAKYDQVMVLIGGDPRIFDLLTAIPEHQKMFLPMVPHEDYPYMLSQFDILLAPLEDNKFNQAKSDIKLMEAGIRKIPWVASPLPPYQAWETGGKLAGSPEEWETALSELVEDQELRISLGQSGHQKALKRESENIADQWLEILAGLD